MAAALLCAHRWAMQNPTQTGVRRIVRLSEWKMARGLVTSEDGMEEETPCRFSLERDVSRGGKTTRGLRNDRGLTIGGGALIVD